MSREDISEFMDVVNAVVEKYKKRLNPKEASASLMSAAIEISCQCAPNLEKAKEFIDHAVTGLFEICKQQYKVKNEKQDTK